MDAQDILISIVVAAYNVEKYLPACLKSIVAQPGEDVEVLVIDDASSDGCGAICEEYARRDARVHVWHHEKNGGVSAARNTGIEHARGKWVAFVDGDDLLSPDALDIMRKSGDSKADLLIFGASTFFDGLAIPEFEAKFQPLVIEGEAMLREYKVMVLNPNAPKREAYRSIHRVSPWARLFRREFLEINHLRFDSSLRRSEDHVFAFLYAHVLKRAELVPRCTYYYRIGQGVSYRFSENALETHSDVFRSLKGIVAAFGEEEDEELREMIERRYKNSLRFTIDLSIAHPNCKWNQKERYEWLQKLCACEWVRSAAEADSSSRMVRAILKRDIKRLDRIVMNRKRTRMIKHTLRANGLGKVLHRLYRHIKER